jgi:methylated-DNA-[protein]-cysteine S-methyltransferase
LAAAAGRAGTTLVRDPGRTDPVASELSGYLDGRVRTFGIPLDWTLTDGAQHTVLTCLHALVGYGETVSYGELAARSGAFHGERGGIGARRVGSIMGSNPLPVVVPCHRVVAADGLGGFGGGLEVKRWLLALEGALPPTLDLGVP